MAVIKKAKVELNFLKTKSRRFQKAAEISTDDIIAGGRVNNTEKRSQKCEDLDH